MNSDDKVQFINKVQLQTNDPHLLLFLSFCSDCVLLDATFISKTSKEIPLRIRTRICTKSIASIEGVIDKEIRRINSQINAAVSALGNGTQFTRNK